MLPKIIFLNGTTSAGKTSIAKALQQLSKTPFIHLEIDTFLAMIRFEHIDCPAIDGVNEVCERLISGFHRTFGAMASVGNSLIIDHVLQEEHWLAECAQALSGHRVYFVGVKCPLELAAARETQRGDRPVGLAQVQYDRVHLHGIYDLEIDTSLESSEHAANRILTYTENHPMPRAFARLGCMLAHARTR